MMLKLPTEYDRLVLFLESGQTVIIEKEHQTIVNYDTNCIKITRKIDYDLSKRTDEITTVVDLDRVCAYSCTKEGELNG